MFFDDLWKELTRVGVVILVLGFLGKFLLERLVDQRMAKAMATLNHKQEIDRQGKDAVLQHAITVSRVQFEVEFEALREIWKRVAEARRALELWSTAPASTDAERLAAFPVCLAAVKEAHRRLSLAIDNNSPFFPAPILALADELRSDLASELMLVEVDDERWSDAWNNDRATAQVGLAMKAGDLSLAITRRLSSLVVSDKPPLPLDGLSDDDAA